MHIAHDVNQIRVTVSADASQATLAIAPDLPSALFTQDLCLEWIRQAGVEVTDFTRAAVADLVAQGVASCDTPRLIARATPPTHGVDGRVDWLVDAGHDQDASHYDRSAYVLVEFGQLLGQVIEPTQEADGRDVRGGTILAKPGRPARLDLDESIIRDAHGRLIAQAQGVLHRQGDQARIRRVIEVDGYVDFSTGHIDFDGDVAVAKGVRDCFVIKARGDVAVKGLIEAATVECTGDLTAAGGFAGREQGHAIVGGTLHARYLDNVQADVRQDVVVDREIINCDLRVAGALRATHGAIIGGVAVVTGRIDVGTLGSGAAVRTQLVLGTVPQLERFLAELTPLVDELTQRRERLLAEQKQIEAAGRRATAADKERQTEILFEMASVNFQWTRGQMAIDALTRRIALRRTVDLSVARKLNAGVSLTVGRQRFTFTDAMRGPVRIFLDESRQVVYKVGDGPASPLTDVAQVSAA